MAPALSSNAFGIAAGLYSKPEPKSSRPGVVVHARTNPFGIGKLKEEKQSEGGSENAEKGGANRFFIDFSKIPDAKSLIPVVAAPSTSLFAGPRRRDPNSVFVAGATGQAGIRIAQALLRQGFVVRAGVPELADAQELARLAATYKIISLAEARRLNAVESAFDDLESMAKAIGPATKVVVTIGPGQNGPVGDVTTDDALSVVQAAKLAGVGHVAIVYDSSGTTLSGSSSTYNMLDGITSFISNISSLFARSQALCIADFLSRVAETDVSYTLIKAAITEDYSAESAHGIVVSEEGTISESKVAKSQIAKLVADVFSNTQVAENKVVEISTSPSATSKSVEELFSVIPEDGRRKAYAETLAKAKAEEEALAAPQKAREAAAAAKKPEAKLKKSSEKEAQADAAGSTLDDLLTKAMGFGGAAGGGFSWEKLSSQISSAVTTQKPEDKATAQIATVRGQAKARSLMPQKAMVKPRLKMPELKPKPKPAAKQPETKAEVRSVFGGLFKQETIYVDED